MTSTARVVTSKTTSRAVTWGRVAQIVGVAVGVDVVVDVVINVVVALLCLCRRPQSQGHQGQHQVHAASRWGGQRSRVMRG